MTENGTQVRRHIAADVFDEEADGPEIIAEWAVLGSAIQSAANAVEALALLSPQHFRRNAHQVIFEAVERLADEGKPVEPMSVMTDLARTGMLARVGSRNLGTGGVFLHSLMERAGSIGFHAPVVIAAAQQRNIAATLESCRQIAGGTGFDPDVHLEQIRKMVEDATAFGGAVTLRPNSETVTEVLDALESSVNPGIPTGYPDLDNAIGGMRPGELIVIGARPGHGKSLIALCIADHAGSNLGLPVLFSSLEMTEAELTQRRISAASRVPLHHLVRHQVSDGEWDMIRRVHDELMTTQLHVDNTPHASLAHIRGQLRAMERAGHPARLLVIDYLGFMAAPRSENRQQAVAELARGAKNALAREFGIPVILLAQLNRGVESRTEKRPTSADLRESGEIEQSADIILLLNREDAYERESPRAGEIDVLITKNRQGPLSTVTLAFQGHYGRIVSMSRDWSPMDAA